MSPLQRKTWQLRSRFYIRLLKILGVFGMGFLAACVKYGSPEVEYGIPWDGEHKIEFSGNIKSSDSLLNLPNISVRLYDEYGYDTVTTTTNAQGNYYLNDWAYEGDQFTMEIIDTDSLANHGYFSTKTLDIEISGRDYSNSERKIDILLDTL